MVQYSFYLKKVLEVLVLSGIVAAIATPISIKIANKFGIIDTPKDNRRVHSRPVPRFGGLGIFAGTMAGLIIPAGMNSNIKFAMIGGALMYLLGALDDIKNLRPAVKFAGQWLIATLVYAMGVRINFITNYLSSTDIDGVLLLSNGIAYLITVIWIVGITNAVNLMDGMDGLAAGTTAIMALSLAYVAYIHGIKLGMMPVCVAFMAVAGGCLGFLPYNFYPAKTFMGDSGALFLGYMIAVLSVISPLKRATFVGAIIPILALAVPIFDTVFAMIRRLARGDSIMSADKGHLHHHLLASGFGQRRSVLVIYGIVGIMGIVAVLLSRELYKDAFFLACIAFLYLMIIIIPKQPQKKKLKDFKRERKENIERKKLEKSENK